MKAGTYSRAVALPARARVSTVETRPVKTAERNGVLHVIGRNGESLGPVSSPRIAESYGRALASIGLTA